MDRLGAHLSPALAAVRGFFATQQRLHQNYLDGFGTSGQEALRGVRDLRWEGDRLIGEALPDGPLA